MILEFEHPLPTLLPALRMNLLLAHWFLNLVKGHAHDQFVSYRIMQDPELEESASFPFLRYFTI